MTVVVGPSLDPLLSIINGPLWFLGVYTMTLLFLPFMWWVHQRNRAIAFVVLIPLATIDSIGVTVLGWPLWIGFFNYLLCWLAIQQLGFFWGESTRQRTWVLVAVVTFVVNAALVYFGPWPMSLVGLPGDILDYDQITILGTTIDVPGFRGEYSNMAPPSVVLLLHGIALVSLVFIARRPLGRLLHRPRVWLVTTFMMLTSMSLYIWHLLAIVLALTTLRQLGLPPPTRLGPDGWPEPISTGEYAVWFAGFLVVFLVLPGSAGPADLADSVPAPAALGCPGAARSAAPSSTRLALRAPGGRRGGDGGRRHPGRRAHRVRGLPGAQRRVVGDHPERARGNRAAARRIAAAALAGAPAPPGRCPLRDRHSRATWEERALDAMGLNRSCGHGAQATGLEVLERLDELRLAAHDERPVGRDRLAQRHSADEEDLEAR